MACSLLSLADVLPWLGGAGFIGSHLADAHLAAGDEVWIVDDLSSGRRENIPDAAHFVEMDIRSSDEVRDLFRDVRFDLVNHHAAQIDVRVSVIDPAKDAGINLLGLLNLTEAAIEVGTPDLRIGLHNRYQIIRLIQPDRSKTPIDPLHDISVESNLIAPNLYDVFASMGK